MDKYKYFLISLVLFVLFFSIYWDFLPVFSFAVWYGLILASIIFSMVSLFKERLVPLRIFNALMVIYSLYFLYSYWFVEIVRT